MIKDFTGLILLAKGINEALYLCKNRSIFLHFYLTGNAMAGVNNESPRV